MFGRGLTKQERYVRDIRNTINPGPIFLIAALILVVLLVLISLPFVIAGSLS